MSIALIGNSPSGIGNVPPCATIVIAVGLLILLVLALLARMRIPYLSEFLWIIAKVFIALSLLAALVTMAPVFGWVVWLVLLAVWIRAAVHWRAVQKQNLFGALALAIDKQMPLAPVALAYAQERHGVLSNRAHALATRLNAGVSLPEAIKKTRGALPPEAAMAARVAAETGDLSATVEATSFGGSFDHTLLQTVMSRLLYIVPAMLLFILFMNTWVTPSYLTIFEYNEQSPSLVAFTALVSTRPLALFCFLITLVILIIFLWAWCEWRGWITPILPGWKRIVRWVEMGVVLRVLALAARRNCSLPRIFDALADTHPKRWVRRRLRTVVDDVKEGCTWQKSLQIEGLIGAADAAILSAAQRSGNLSWALGEMADAYQRRANFRLQALGQVILPLLIVPAGVLVCILTIAYFAPLASMIEGLSR